MSSDLIERLRDYGLTLEPNVVMCHRSVVDEAAATIAQLQAELAEAQKIKDQLMIAAAATVKGSMDEYKRGYADAAREVPGRIVEMIGRDFDAPHIIDVGRRIATAIEARDWSKP